MRTPDQAGRTLLSKLGLALVVAFTFVIGAAPAGAMNESAQLEDEATGEVSQALTVSYECSNAGGTILGGLNVTIIGGAVVNCIRTSAIASGGAPPPPPPPGMVSCWALARSIGCPGY